jgi:hypothetical protein
VPVDVLGKSCVGAFLVVVGMEGFEVVRVDVRREGARFLGISEWRELALEAGWGSVVLEGRNGDCGVRESSAGGDQDEDGFWTHDVGLFELLMFCEKKIRAVALS